MDINFTGLNRVQILLNGKELLGTSIESNLETDEELISFLEELVKVLKAPKIPILESEKL